MIRAFPLGVPNAKYLAFDTPNTKKHLIAGVLNAKTFGTSEQYRSKFGTVRTQMPNQKKKKKLFDFFSLFSQICFSLPTCILSLSPSFFFRLDSQPLSHPQPQPQTPFSLFAPQIKPK